MMKMTEIMKGRFAEITEKVKEGYGDEKVGEVGAMFKDMVGEMSASVTNEAIGEGLQQEELVAVCAAFGVAHKILYDVIETDGKVTASTLVELVYASTRVLAIGRRVEL